MALQHAVFELYHRGNPPKIEVWRTQAFKQETGELYWASSPADRAHFANVNQLIERFARGEQLSQQSFRKERVGYAFKSGRLRFYGVYSTQHGSAFVLSHAIIKRHDKLHDADMQRMQACLAAFDSIVSLSAIPT
jgi:hypothetical protein